MICKNMKWARLPEPGGLYDQNPQLIDRFYAIMAAEAVEQERESKKKEAEMGGPGARQRKSSMGSRPNRR